jgi:probable F420-dependent oxidoreductase
MFAIDAGSEQEARAIAETVLGRTDLAATIHDDRTGPVPEGLWTVTADVDLSQVTVEPDNAQNRFSYLTRNPRRRDLGEPGDRRQQGCGPMATGRLGPAAGGSRRAGASRGPRRQDLGPGRRRHLIRAAAGFARDAPAPAPRTGNLRFMKVGFGAPVSGAWATPENLAGFAARAEQAGYASLWSFQRLLVPEGSGMDEVYQSVLDPMAALAYVAAGTSTIRLGVAVVNLPFVSPAYLAKQAASVDILSGGRLDLGLGIGWMPEEFAVTGASMARRGARAAEYVAVLRELWSDGPSEFSGEFYEVPRGGVYPKPVQPGGPPVLLGGLARPALERAGRIADGWVTSSRTDLSRIAEGVGVIRAAAAEAGRDPEAMRIVCRGVVRAGAERPGPGGDRLLLSGSPEQIKEDTKWLGTQGVTEIFYDLNWDPEVGSPNVDPAAATARAAQLLDALAPSPADG